MDRQFISSLNTSLGRFVITSSAHGITSIALSEEQIEENESHHTFLCRSELMDYFDGRLKDFTVNLDISQHTAFHQKVWNELKSIPYGKTISYTDLSIRIGNLKAIRAVGRANGSNPIPFIIPCHRVIGADGSLTGYALGLDMKRKLLTLENKITYPAQASLF